jgi:hypothetical protein
MKNILLVMAICLISSAAWAMEAPVAVTNTARIAGIEVANDQILITLKTGYVHLLWDAFPSQEAIRAKGKAFNLENAVRDLVFGPGLASQPEAMVFKVDVVEYFEKDSYGTKRWDKVRSLGRFEVALKCNKWLVKQLKI